MKNLILIAILIFGTYTTSSAQNFSKNDNFLNLGIGLGTPFFGIGYSASLPVNPSIAYDHAVTDEISVGGTLSYASSKYTYDSDDYFKLSATYLAARGTYHFNELLNISKTKFDLYGGANIGYVVVTATDGESSAAGASDLGYSLFGGTRYFFKPKLGVYAELGYSSLSVLNSGLSFKF